MLGSDLEGKWQDMQQEGPSSYQDIVCYMAICGLQLLLEISHIALMSSLLDVLRELLIKIDSSTKWDAVLQTAR